MSYEEHVERLLASAPPGTRIIYMEVPAEGSAPSTPGATTPQEGASSTLGMTDLEVASNAHGSGPLKSAQWAERLPMVSAREIDRAISAGALTASPKGYGRDHAAIVVSATDMVDYLALCDAVQDGRRTPPTWWDEVRKGPNAEIIRTAA